MKELSAKNNFFSESIIRGMTKLAIKNNALNLSQGFPEFAPPIQISNRLKEISDDVRFQQYSVGHGAYETRLALTQKQKYFTGIDFNPDTEVAITCGGTEAMMSTLMTVCNKGDKVIVFTPVYENYTTQCMFVGVDIIYVPLDKDKQYTFDANILEDAFRQNPKAIILCNPSNPCGRVFTIDEMKIIADLAKKYDTYVITDEVYEHIVFDDNRMVYMAALPDMRERTIVCGSLSKTYAITGWRIGYVIAPENIMNSLKKIHNFLTIAAPTPLQEAVVVGLKFPKEYYDDVLKLYTKNRNILLDGFKNIGIKYNKPEGTYFMLIDLREYVKKSGAKNDIEFAEMLCKKVGVCVVPCESFFVGQNIDGIFRVHFAKSEKTLYEAINRMENIKKVF